MHIYQLHLILYTIKYTILQLGIIKLVCISKINLLKLTKVPIITKQLEN